jgi:hypothetical protein
MEMKPKTRLGSRPPRLLLAALAGSSLAAVACGGSELEQRDLGNTSVLDKGTEHSDPNERIPVILADGWIDTFVEGHWVGQAEDLFSPAGPSGERPTYTFPSGSTQISLDLSLSDPTFPTGQITFGEGAVPKPAAGVPYPPGFDAQLAGDAAGLGGVDLPLPPLEGFSYGVLESIWRLSDDKSGVAAGALAVGYAANASYADWCALQPSEPNGTSFDCISPSPLGKDAACTRNGPDTDLHFDCRLGSLCEARNVCTCVERGCQAAAASIVQLWLMRSGENLIGSFVGAVFDYGGGGRFLPVGNVRFQREEP